MPTGTGKTGVIALSGILLAKKDVLIVTPWDNLRTQMVEALETKFWENSGITKPEGFRAKAFSGKHLVDQLKKIEPDTPRTFWVTTFQGLWTTSKSKDTFSELRSRLDLVVIDEGHYEPAMWWGRAAKALKTPTILFTATPYRNDLKYFRIRKEDVSHYKYKVAVADDVIRRVAPEPLKEAGGSVEDIVAAIADKWSRAKKRTLANPHPKMIVCCRDFQAVKAYTLQLAKLDLPVIGIHIRATKKHLSTKQLKLFRNKVPKEPTKEAAEIWVHEKMLTEGLDHPPFCALAITYDMRNDRKLIQQIGRIVRRADDDRHNEAKVYSIADASVESSWEAFETFEDDFRVVTTEHFRNFVDAHLKNQPEVEYFGKRFRRQLVPGELTPEVARRELLTLPSVVARRAGKNFKLDTFLDEVTDALQLEDYIVLGPIRDTPVVSPKDASPATGAVWLYCRLSNSRTLLAHSAYEVKLSALCVVEVAPFVFITDTDSFVPADALEEHTVPLSLSELRQGFASGYLPTRVQLKNSLPHQSVVRGTTRSGKNLAEVPNSLTESKYICSSIHGRNPTEGRRYVGFTTGRLSDDRNGMRRYEMCFTDLTKWCEEVAKVLRTSAATHTFFLRFARLVDPPAAVEPRYGFLDFWSGDFTLVDQDGKTREPMDAVFQFIPEDADGDDKAPKAYRFQIRGELDGKEETAELRSFWRDGRFHFKAVETNGLVIREAITSSSGEEESTRDVEIASFCSRKQGDLFISLASSNVIFNSGSFFEVDPTSNYADLGGMFIGCDELNRGGLSEKNPKAKKKMKSWCKDSIFGIASSDSFLVREFGGKPDLIVCDDGSDEIADFVLVQFDPPKFVLVHCKSKPRKDDDKELRAVSELQEVVSQASKNLVYMSGRSQIPPHIDEWTKTSNVYGFNVPRLQRKVGTTLSGVSLWNHISESVLLSRNTEKEVWIMVGGALTKSWIDRELAKCKRAQSNLACLFHMVDGLSASCTEANARLKVFCNSGGR
jgi:superfamily II DNA or RNA helicase